MAQATYDRLRSEANVSCTPENPNHLCQDFHRHRYHHELHLYNCVDCKVGCFESELGWVLDYESYSFLCKGCYNDRTKKAFFEKQVTLPYLLELFEKQVICSGHNVAEDIIKVDLTKEDKDIFEEEKENAKEEQAIDQDFEELVPFLYNNIVYHLPQSSFNPDAYKPVSERFLQVETRREVSI